MRRLVRLLLCAVLAASTVSSVGWGSPSDGGKAADDSTTYAPSTQRIAGSSPAELAESLALQGWSGSSQAVIVPSGNALYAAVAAPLAACLNAPILVADRSLPSATSRALTRMKTRSVVIVGPTSAISLSAQRSLDRKFTVRRVAGPDVYQTAAKVAAEVKRRGKSTEVIVAPASSAAQALSAAYWASLGKKPLLLSRGRSLPKSTRAALKSLAPKHVVLLGSTRLLPTSLTTSVKAMGPSVSRISTDSAAALSSAVAKTAVDSGVSLKSVLVVSDTVAQSLAAPALSARGHSTMLMTGSVLATSTEAFLSAHGSSIRTIVIGAPKATLSDELADAAKRAASTTISDTAVTLDETNNASLENVTSETVTFSKEAANAPELQVGDVLASGITTDAPNGFLRKVTGVSTVGDTVVVQTSEASLDEVITKGSFDIHRTLTPAGASAAVTAAGVRMATVGASGATEFGLKLDGVIYDADGKSSTTLDRVRLDGSISFSPDIDVNGEFSLGEGLKRFEFVTSMTEKVKVRLTAGGNIAAFSKKIEIYRQNLAPINIQIGPVPVVIVPVVKVYIGADGSVSIGITTGASQTMTVRGGVRYENGSWSRISSRSSSFAYDAPHLVGTAQARAYAGAGIELLIYGSVGPEATIEAYVRATATMDGDPPWQVWAGIAGRAGAQVRIFSKVVAYWSTELFTFEISLAKGKSVDKTPPTIVDDVTSTYVRTATVRLTATDSVSGVKSVSYRLDGGTAVTVLGSGAAITVSTLGNHRLEYWAVDNAGNTSLHVTKQFRVDATPTWPDATGTRIIGATDGGCAAANGNLAVWTETDLSYPRTTHALGLYNAALDTTTSLDGPYRFRIDFLAVDRAHVYALGQRDISPEVDPLTGHFLVTELWTYDLSGGTWHRLGGAPYVKGLEAYPWGDIDADNGRVIVREVSDPLSLRYDRLRVFDTGTNRSWTIDGGPESSLFRVEGDYAYWSDQATLNTPIRQFWSLDLRTGDKRLLFTANNMNGFNRLMDVSGGRILSSSGFGSDEGTIFDMQGNVLERLQGFSPARMTGRSVLGIVPEDELPEVKYQLLMYDIVEKTAVIVGRNNAGPAFSWLVCGDTFALTLAKAGVLLTPLQ